MKSITIKTYKGNAELFFNNSNITVYYDSDTLQVYNDKEVYANRDEALEAVREDFKEQITERLLQGERCKNLDDVVQTLMMHADGRIW